MGGQGRTADEVRAEEGRRWSGDGAGVAGRGRQGQPAHLVTNADAQPRLGKTSNTASTLTVQHSAQLVQVRMHARELDGDLVDRVHKILDHEDVVGIVLLRGGWRRGRGRGPRDDRGGFWRHGGRWGSGKRCGR